jgi:hypothetical protein
MHTAYAKHGPAWPVARPHFVGATRHVAAQGAIGTARTISSGVELRFVSGVGGGGGGMRMAGPSCRAATSSSLVQGWSAEYPTWVDASSLKLQLPPPPPPSPPPPSPPPPSEIHAALLATFAQGIPPPTRVRVGMDAKPPGCVLLNANDLPPLPLVANVSAAATAAGSAQPHEPHEPRRHPLAPAGPAALATTPATPLAAPARLPPMGFNTWNRWHCWVDESELRRTADLMVSLGLVDAGYRYLNIDDCWQSARVPPRPGGGGSAIVTDPVRFPSGLRAFSDYAHSRKLRFGLYTSQTELTCQARPGSYRHEVADAEAYCEADVDYLKIDACGGDRHPSLNTSWVLFRAALDTCASSRGRPFLMACSSCGVNTGGGVAGCGQWIADGPVSCDVWRTGGDIQARWSSIINNLEQNTMMAPVQNSHPGHFNDPDMLQVCRTAASRCRPPSATRKETRGP